MHSTGVRNNKCNNKCYTCTFIASILLCNGCGIIIYIMIMFLNNMRVYFTFMYFILNRPLGQTKKESVIKLCK